MLKQIILNSILTVILLRYHVENVKLYKKFKRM